MINILNVVFKKYHNLLIILLGIFGIWLCYWDVSAFATQGLNTGIWDIGILTAGGPSIIVGIVIIIGVSVYFRVKVL